MYRLLIAAMFVARIVPAEPRSTDTLQIAVLVPAWQTRADSLLVAGVVQGLSEAARAASLFGGAISLIRVQTPQADGLQPLLRSLRSRGVSALIARDVGGLATRGAGGPLTYAWCNAVEAAATAVGMLFVDAGCASVESRSACSALTVRVWPGEKDRAAALTHVPPDESAIARVVVWDSTLERYGADQLNQRFRAAAHRSMTSEAWSGWMAMKVLWEASMRAHSTQPVALARTLLDPASRFDGHKGHALSFRAQDHRLEQPLYVIVQRGRRRIVVDVSDSAATSRAALARLSSKANGTADDARPCD